MAATKTGFRAGRWKHSKLVSRTQIKRLLWTIRRTCKKEMFYAEYKKRTTGKRRRIYAAFGISKHVKGVGHKFNPGYLHLMTVYDLKKKEYRFLSLERLNKVIWKRTRYVVH